MILICDISKWNLFEDYSLLAQRAQGVYIKASEGSGPNPDKRFIEHWSNTKKFKMLRGAYHWWKPQVDAKQQAQFFFDTVNSTGDLGEFPPALDIEESGSAAHARACMEEIEHLFGRTPIIYTRQTAWDPQFAPSKEEPKDEKKKKKKSPKGKPTPIMVAGLSGDLSWASEYPLWVANYLSDDLDASTKDVKDLVSWSEDLIDRWVKPGTRKPDLPSTWKSKSWKIWQVYQIGRGKDWGQKFPDSKQIDLNVFNGTMEDLIAFAGGAQPGTAQIGALSEMGAGTSKPTDEGQAPEKEIETGVTDEQKEPEKPSGFDVVVNAEKTVLQHFKKTDGSGKPIMVPQDPRVILRKGARLTVSDSHKAVPRDPGDGTVFGTGNKEYYFVIASPSDPSGVGRYVKGQDVRKA